MARPPHSDRRFRPPLHRIAAAATAALLAVAAGSLQPVIAHATAPETAATAAADASTLTKSAQNITRPGQSPVEHGDTVNWTVGYHNAGSGEPAPATLTDPVEGAGTAQSYVPGSLRVPPGWTPSWSTDGSTFVPTDQGAATTAVRASNPAATGDGTSVRGGLLPPVQAATRSTGGDGFTPILYRADSGDVEAWNLYHHSGPAARLAVCNDLSTGQPCSGGPWPRPLNTTPGPLGSGDTGNVFTTLTPQYVFDPGRPGVVYYPAYAAGSVGVGCLDLGARANCGFVGLLAAGGSPSSANGLAGLVATGGNIYGVASTGQVLCMAIATRTPCAGQPFAAIVPPNHDLPGGTFSLYLGGTVVADGRIYASSSPQTSGSTAAGPPALGCFDPATGAVCAGWTTPHPVGPNASFYTYNAFASYDTAGQPDGVCVAASNAGAPATTCYTLDGAPAAVTATGLAGLSAGALVFNPEVVTAGGETRSYFPAWGGTQPGNTVCHSWTTSGPCAGFPTAAGHPAVNGGVTRDYGYSYDATTRCLIGLGDAGILFSMDPATGVSPCVHSGASVQLKPADFYCDGAAGHVRGYTQARLEDFDVSHANLAASTVSVTDAGGVVATPALAPDGTVDLSGISAADHPAITVTVQLVLTGTGDFTATNHPALTASFDGDDPQVCLRTVVTTDCATTQVTDTATGTDATGELASNTVSLAVSPGSECRPVVAVNKEICTVASSHACGPGGAGPWAKNSPVGLLGLLGTAHWRITVTNTGPVDAVNVTVNDPTTPSCRTAAGTFTLAAGATRQVYCSSFLLALPLKNTATATFSAAGAPHGTPPATTAPSSAVACSLLCVLVGDTRS